MCPMSTNAASGWELAPGRLGLVHGFLNILDAEPTADELAMASAFRRRREQGESQAALAKAFGLSQPLISAIAGGRRLAPPGDGRSGGLGSPSQALTWLVDHGVWDPHDPVSEADLARLRELKRLLKPLVFANNGAALDANSVAGLDDFARGVPLVASFSNPQAPSVAAAATGIEGVIGRLLGAVVEAAHDGTWSRLRACPGSGCGWVFYDVSPSGARTWCWMSLCGNRAKVRNYQRRRRSTTPA